MSVFWKFDSNVVCGHNYFNFIIWHLKITLEMSVSFLWAFKKWAYDPFLDNSATFSIFFCPSSCQSLSKLVPDCLCTGCFSLESNPQPHSNINSPFKGPHIVYKERNFICIAVGIILLSSEVHFVLYVFLLHILYILSSNYSCICFPSSN